jgi:hypothetical protein
MRLFWTKEQLIELLELRLRQIITGTYSNRILPTVKDILPPKSKSKSDGMTYILERTFMRPRDVIHYFNICVQSSVGRTSFNWDIIRTAELQYSQSRLESLQYEWQENYPGLNNIFKTFHGQSNPFYLKDFENDKIISLLQREMDNPKADWLNRLMRQYVEQGEIALSSIKLGLIIVLFQTGFLGIKPSPQDCVVYSFLPFASIVSEDLSSDTLLEIHPTFHRALGVKSEY